MIARFFGCMYKKEKRSVISAYYSLCRQLSNHDNTQSKRLRICPSPCQLFSLRKGDVVTATNFHERHQELATAVDVAEEQKEANKSLINVSESSNGTFAFRGNLVAELCDCGRWKLNSTASPSTARPQLATTSTTSQSSTTASSLSSSRSSCRCTESSRRSASRRGTTRGPSSTGPRAWKRQDRRETKPLWDRPVTASARLTRNSKTPRGTLHI